MRRYGFLGILPLLAALLTVPAAAWAAPPQAWRFHKQVVMDKQGFNMEAFRLLVPSEWRFQGGVTWDMQKFPAQSTTRFTVASPDGRSVLEAFPPDPGFWSQDPNLQASYARTGARIHQPMKSVDYLREVFLPRHRKGISDVKVLESGPLPELAKHDLELVNYHMRIFHQISPFTFRFETAVDAGHLRVQYRQQGQTIVEDLIGSVTYMTSYFQGMYGTTVGISWIPAVKSFRAPASEMAAKAPLFKVVLDSFQENPAWTVACTRFSATATRDRIRQQQAAFNRMQEIRRSSQNEISDMIVKGYQQRSAAQDRIFDKYSETVRGVETYRDPVNEREVQLPNGMSNAWTNGSEYVFSDQAGYNPNIGSTQNWQRMEKKP